MLKKIIVTLSIACAGILASPTATSAKSVSIPITEITYVQDSRPHNNFFTDPNIIVGFVVPECDASTPRDIIPWICDKYRSMIYLKIKNDDLKDIDPDTIESATIHLYLHDMRLWTVLVVEGFTVTEPWDPSTITLTNHVPWSNQVISSFVRPEAGWKTLEATDWVRSIIRNPENDNGIVLLPRQPKHESGVFYSPSCTKDSNNPCPHEETPFLEVYFREPNSHRSVTLLSPSNDSTICTNNVLFDWNSTLEEKTDFTLQIHNPGHSIIDQITPAIPPHLATITEDGTFSWSIEGFDHQSTFTVDTSPPDAPVINKEPTETPGLTNTVSWSGQPDSHLYLAEASDNSNFDKILQSSEWIKSTSFTFTGLNQEVTYYYRIFAKDFCDNVSLPSTIVSSTQGTLPVSPLESSSDSEPIITPLHPSISLPMEEGILSESTQESTKSPNDEFAEKSLSNITTPTCIVYLFEPDNTYRIASCSIPNPTISSIKHSRTEDLTSELSIYGHINNKIKLVVHRFVCAPRTLFAPSTWFNCKRTYVKKNRFILTPHSVLSVSITGESNPITNSDINTQGKFSLSISSRNNLSNKNLLIRLEQRAFKKVAGTWIDIKETSQSKRYQIPKSHDVIASSKPFSFVFGAHIGVTQWHGYTAYQSPHTGIDFGATSEKVISPADGIIDSVGWDTSGGQCLSGGNIVRIKHKNGMYSAYFHLKHYRNKNGTPWKSGDIIQRGDQVGISGNSGAWNCQSLGYHLHYELRKSRSQTTHVNPVPYTNVNWNHIPTLGWTTNPGRLTGDNPHPKF